MLGLENTEIQATDQPGRALLLGWLLLLLDEKRVLHDSWPMDLLCTAVEQHESWFHAACRYLDIQHTQALDTPSFCVQFAASRIWIATQLTGPSH